MLAFSSSIVDYMIAISIVLFVGCAPRKAFVNMEGDQMSTLNDQNTTESDVLVSIITGKTDKINEDELHQLDLDTKILQAIFENDIRPNLDYLTGYAPLEEFAPDRLFKSNWVELLKKHGLTHIKKSLLISSEYYYSIDADANHSKLRLRVFLTRGGSWVIQEKYPDTFHLASGVEDAVYEFKKIDELVDYTEKFATYKLDGYSSSFGKYVPIVVAKSLVHQLQVSVDHRKQLLSRFESSLSAAQRRLAYVPDMSNR